MALKSDRYEESTDISFFYVGGTGTRGGVVCLDELSASGAALDQGDNTVLYKYPSYLIGISTHFFSYLMGAFFLFCVFGHNILFVFIHFIDVPSFVYF